MNRDRVMVALLLAIAHTGYRGKVGAHALSSLVCHAQVQGVWRVVRWVELDPGLLLFPSWQFPTREIR